MSKEENKKLSEKKEFRRNEIRKIKNKILEDKRYLNYLQGEQFEKMRLNFLADLDKKYKNRNYSKKEIENLARAEFEKFMKKFNDQNK